jgi:chromate transport protein ChrA
VNVVAGLAGSLGLLSVIVTLLTLAALSQRIGEVTKMPPLYRGFYIGAACLVVALFVRLLRVSTLMASPEGAAFLNDDLFYLLAYHLPSALGLTVSLVVTWRYWSWLLREQI